MNKKKKHKSSWFINSILTIILGGISIVLLFCMNYYQTAGIFLWSVIIAWVIILIVTAIIFGMQEQTKRRIEKEHEKIINELKQSIEELKKQVDHKEQ
ncbi:MAG TPA: hypothetical protein ENG70_01875 [Candidatus Cloacimonetes bacterium]|nr:hypothetical protein [Candidatus Cloacimonadota bacterium]HEX37599.1 hypothetical protein [Candidatus Cloacimonadota bacterium]